MNDGSGGSRPVFCLLALLERTHLCVEARPNCDPPRSPVRQFDLKDRTWRLVAPLGSPPASRFGYVSVVHANRFVLFGGYDGTTWLNDTHEYNFDTQ